MTTALADGACWRRLLRHLQRAAAPLFLPSLARAFDPPPGFLQSAQVNGHSDNRLGTCDAARQGVQRNPRWRWTPSSGASAKALTSRTTMGPGRASEAGAVADRHVHPAEPRKLRLSLRVAS
jgi:hypothetical protein